MNVLSVKTNTNLEGRKMSESLLIQEHIQWFHTISLQFQSQLLTPDDEIIKARLGRKHRWRWTKKQYQRRQLEVLGQLMNEES